MIKCKSCKNNVPKGAKVCPACGAKVKKPWYKQWWIWGIVCIFIIIGNINSTTQPVSNDDVVIGPTQIQQIDTYSNYQSQINKLENITMDSYSICEAVIPNFISDFKTIESAGNHSFAITLQDKTQFYLMTFAGEEYFGHTACIMTGEKEYKDRVRLYDAVIRNGKIVDRIACQHEYGKEEILKATYLSPKTITKTCSICGGVSQTEEGKKLSPISFEMTSYKIDFLGGITIKTKIRNNTDEEIKYAYFTLRFYNAVGDIIYSDMHNTASDGSMTWEVTGPIKPNKTKSFNGIGFYNHNFKGSYQLVKYTVVFMDGTQYSFTDLDSYDKVFID